MSTDIALKLYNQGLAAQEKQRFSQSLRFYKAALHADMHCRPALLGLGLVYSRMGQTRLALGFFRQAYELKGDAIVCFNLGGECFKLQEYDRCRNYLKECLRFDKHVLKAHLLLAYLYQKTNKPDKAAIYFQNALKLSPMNRMAILGYTASLSEQGQYEVALYAIERYLGKVKSDSFARELRAGLLLQMGRIDTSYKEYARLVRTSPRFTNFSDHLKSLHAEAAQEYKQTLEGIDDKIVKRAKRLQVKLASRKTARQAHDLSAHKNGIEGSQDLADELKQELRDMVDLSLLHLFKGDADKALQYLFQARKWKENL